MSPTELRALAEDAEETINYAFGEPHVAMSRDDVLLLADQLDQLMSVIHRGLDLDDETYLGDWKSEAREILMDIKNE